MTNLIPDEAVEPALRAWFEYERTAHPASTLGDRMRAALTAAAPLIAAQALDGHRCDEQAERAYQRAATAEAENRDLRAGIEALRDEWREFAAKHWTGTVPRATAALHVKTCADDLAALLDDSVPSGAAKPEGVQHD